MHNCRFFTFVCSLVLLAGLAQLTIKLDLPKPGFSKPVDARQIHDTIDRENTPTGLFALNDPQQSPDSSVLYAAAGQESAQKTEQVTEPPQQQQTRGGKKVEKERLSRTIVVERVAPPPPEQAEGRKGADTPPPPPPPAPPPPPVQEPEDDPGEPPPVQPPAPPPPARIMLGWHFVSMNTTAYVQHPASQTGYNVYAPVVYFLVGSGENIRIARHSEFSRGVLIRARENGYQVWITVQQFGPDRPHELFANPDLQAAVIHDLVQKAFSDGAHGLNIDFENMGLANRDGFTRFMRELHTAASEYGLLLSVDVTRPGTSSWAACYDHGALAGACDYLVLMAYDQYYAGSPVEGPVASLSWTESAITAVLGRGVPPGKLILGMPFYSRNWVMKAENEIKVTRDSILVTGDVVNLRSGPTTASSILGTTLKNSLHPCLETVQGEKIDGNPDWYKISYKDGTAYLSATLGRLAAAGEVIGGAYSVSGTFALGLQHTLAMQNNYNPDTGTSYYETTSGRRNMTDVTMSDSAGLTLLTYRDQNGVYNKIWLENYDSLRQRYQLINKYNLAGSAAWSLEWQNYVASPWLEMVR